MNAMNSKERVLTALEHKEPDRVPADMWIIKDAYVKLRKFLNLPEVDLSEPGFVPWLKDTQVDIDVLENFNIDIVRVSTRPPEGREMKKLPDGYFIDEWMVKFVEKSYAPGIDGSYYSIIESPLRDATIKDLDDFPWPNPHDPAVVEELPNKIKPYKESGYAIMGQFGRGGPFEWAKQLRGYDQIFIDFASEPDLVAVLMDKLTELSIEYNRVGIEAVGEDIDIVRLCPEDLGSMESTLVSPKMYDEIIRPCYQRLWSTVKKKLVEKNPRGKLQFHSCGAIYPLIPRMIADKLDILDSMVKSKGMEPARLKEDFGDRLSFLGGVDTQHTLPLETPEVVNQEVRELIKVMAPRGGYIFSSAHRIQPDVPCKNIVAMYEAAKEFGTYPIRV